MWTVSVVLPCVACALWPACGASVQRSGDIWVLGLVVVQALASVGISAYGCILRVSFRPLHPFHAVVMPLHRLILRNNYGDDAL